MTTRRRPRFGERIAASFWRGVLKLPKGPADYTVERAIRITMRDGTHLVADHWAPEGPAAGTVLVHTPYGRNALWGAIYGAPYASRGYHVVMCSARGTFGSQGDFEPMMHEVDDTADVVSWLRDQTWFEGRFAMVGASYLGFTQWATLMDPPPELAAVIIQVGFHDLSRSLREGGAFKLNDFLAWSAFVSRQEEFGILRGLIHLATIGRRIAPAFAAVPLAEGTARVLGGRAPWFARWLEHTDLADPYWAPVQLGGAVEQVKIPVLLHTGWMDIFLDQTMQQYAELARRGVDVGLTIGPWMHNDIEGKAAPQLIGEALDWLDTHFGVSADDRRSAAVKVYVTGSAEWRDLPRWPPATTPVVLHPHPDGALRESSATTGTAGFTFDPAVPTPTIGGRLLNAPGGYRDDTSLAERTDVLVFTGDPLTESLEIAGVPVVTLRHHCDNANADLFVRISEVGPKGRSRNVTDGFIRLVPPDVGPTAGDQRVKVELDATAHRFAAGSRIRLIVAGGSFPRFDRNPGTGQAPKDAAVLVPSFHTLNLDGCDVTLPVTRPTA